MIRSVVAVTRRRKRWAAVGLHLALGCGETPSSSGTLLECHASQSVSRLRRRERCCGLCRVLDLCWVDFDLCARRGICVAANLAWCACGVYCGRRHWWRCAVPASERVKAMRRQARARCGISSGRSGRQGGATRTDVWTVCGAARMLDNPAPAASLQGKRVMIHYVSRALCPHPTMCRTHYAFPTMAFNHRTASIECFFHLCSRHDSKRIVISEIASPAPCLQRRRGVLIVNSAL